MSRDIKTVGDLREFLVNMMIGVKNGDVDSQDAGQIVRLAAQVNESFYSEIKVAKIRRDVTGEAFEALGQTPIGAKKAPEQPS